MKKIILAACAIIMMSQISTAQQVAPFKRGDRVTFVGNSITDGGHYHSYIWLYYMTHFPNEEMKIFNCGIGGDTGADIFKRLDGDVFAKSPTVLTLTFGMNDSGYFEYNGNEPEKFADQQVEKSYNNYKLIENRLKNLVDTRIVMIGTSPYDQDAKLENTIFKKKNDAICRMIDFQKKSAEENKWEFLDFNQPMMDINHEMQKENPAFTLCGGDRIHPDNDGHMVMAYLFLQAQGMVGKKVADVAIDARKKKVQKAENCNISNLKVASNTVSFDYLANSLPYPLDTIARGWGFKRSQSKVVSSLPSFMKDLSDEALTVTGLKGNYRLTIDGEEIGVFPATILATGINLAEYTNTPQYQQSLAIMNLNEERWEIERRVRDYAWLQFGYFQKLGLLDVYNQKAIKAYQDGAKKDGWVRSRGDLYGKAIHKAVRDAWDAEMDLLVSAIYDINKPVTRKVVLTLVK